MERQHPQTVPVLIQITMYELEIIRVQQTAMKNKESPKQETQASRHC